MISAVFSGTAAAVGIVLTLLLPKIQKSIPRLHPAFLWMFAALPVCFGGFFTWLSVPVSGLLLYYLFLGVQRKKQLAFCFNLSSVSVLLIYLGFLFTPLWAADKGMAVFGIVRYLPLVFYALLMMQMSDAERLSAFSLIPLTGAGMTAVSFLLQFIPALTEHFTVNGRLSGFFQYPNTFALFLLIGFFIQGTKSSRRLWDITVDLLLILGIILSGSRAVFVLLAATVLLLIVYRRNLKFSLLMLAVFALCLGGSYLVSQLSPLHNSDRFTEITLSSSTFLGRLLYYKDVLRVILRNPFGLGYFGYHSMQGSFQTGNYSVAYIHNGFLQLLFEIGWIPALLFAAALLKTVFSKNTPFMIKGILLIALAHCMFDFNLQYLVIWFLLLTALPLTEGKVHTVKQAKPLLTVISVPLLSIALWLGAGDLLYHAGNSDACLQVTPFHTDALIFSLTGESDPAVLDEKGDRILRLNANASIAYSAKANAAFANGDVQAMIAYKEQAIRCAKYSIEEYCDYISKLLAAYQVYAQMNDTASAQYCLTKLAEIEPMIDAVNRSTDPLADLLADDSTLTLPAEYSEALRSLLH